MFWAVLLLGALWLLTRTLSGELNPLAPTPTPTRSGISWAQEGQALAASGDLDGAIEAYQNAVRTEPEDAQLHWELAQFQAYSSVLLITDEEKFARLNDALDSATLATELGPRESNAHAIRAFVLDWYASSNLISATEREDFLFQAANEAATAINLDKNNALALAYNAEVLLDQQQWSLAQQMIEQAAANDPTLMDVHRVRGQVYETLGQYNIAIEAYQQAADIAPNLTFLYLYIGYNYRHLRVYNRALEYFDLAATINQQIQVEDPLPYLAIAKTYAQQGEFFIAARNGERALAFDPQNPAVYGQLGTIYVQARNYETAVPVLRCAVYGCTAEENEVAQTVTGTGYAVEGLPLTSLEVAYFYVRYGSVLAALNRCDEAGPVLEQLLEVYGNDPTIPEIVAENYNICRILAGDT
jgi:tetratricopeptide (TPR) repeat protein